ncbi:MAG TPA: hypothetical protein VGU20_06695 [Stellaceae bacterium]|nr:hypothetical protein [Stellaceae bacterium]
MAHRVVLDVLHAQAQRYTEAVQREPDPQKMRKLAVTASALSQLFEQLERGVALSSADIAAYREMLGHVDDAELRAAIDTLLDPKVNSAAS